MKISSGFRTVFHGIAEDLLQSKIIRYCNRKDLLKISFDDDGNLLLPDGVKIKDAFKLSVENIQSHLNGFDEYWSEDDMNTSKIINNGILCYPDGSNIIDDETSEKKEFGEKNYYFRNSNTTVSLDNLDDFVNRKSTKTSIKSGDYFIIKNSLSSDYKFDTIIYLSDLGKPLGFTLFNEPILVKGKRSINIKIDFNILGVDFLSEISIDNNTDFEIIESYYSDNYTLDNLPKKKSYNRFTNCANINLSENYCIGCDNIFFTEKRKYFSTLLGKSNFNEVSSTVHGMDYQGFGFFLNDSDLWISKVYQGSINNNFKIEIKNQSLNSKNILGLPKSKSIRINFEEENYDNTKDLIISSVSNNYVIFEYDKKNMSDFSQAIYSYRGEKRKFSYLDKDKGYHAYLDPEACCIKYVNRNETIYNSFDSYEEEYELLSLIERGGEIDSRYFLYKKIGAWYVLLKKDFVDDSSYPPVKYISSYGVFNSSFISKEIFVLNNRCLLYQDILEDNIKTSIYLFNERVELSSANTPSFEIDSNISDDESKKKDQISFINSLRKMPVDINHYIPRIIGTYNGLIFYEKDGLIKLL